MRNPALVLSFCLSFCGLATFAACQKAAPAAPIVPGTPASPRRVEVKVSNQGFTPARVPGKPGESLTLLFKYDKSAGECGRQVVVPDQHKTVTLSEEHPTEIALTLPTTTGEVGFTCGMNMLRGAIVIE
jgi:plastocyanin domain-containing protein